MIIVADSSPLISFAIIGKLNLLSQIFSEIYIPEAVFTEITAWKKPFSRELTVFAEPHRKAVQNRLAVQVLMNELDEGESEAIILALENEITDILIDEHKGRRIAISNGLHPIGTIGVLLEARHRGLLEKIKPSLDKLIANKVRISVDLYLFVSAEIFPISEF